MKKVNIFKDIEGMTFPAPLNRRTRVMYGANGALDGEQDFCQGYVVIQPGGHIPLHDHETVETYTILKGHGKLTIGDETEDVGPGDTAMMDKWLPHGLVNDGNGELHLMFVYSPKIIVDHWAKEASGEMK